MEKKKGRYWKLCYYFFVLWVILYTLQLRCKEAVEVVEEPKSSTLLIAHILCQVYSKMLSFWRGTCQYPDIASSKLKYSESASSGSMSSTVLPYRWFLFIAWLRSFGSRDSCRELSGLLTGTMELIHSVCFLTSLMTPSCVNLSNSAL